MKLVRNVIAPIIFIFLLPFISILFWYTARYLDGNITLLFIIFKNHGLIESGLIICNHVFIGSKIAYLLLSIFIIFELIIMKYLPGKIVSGSQTKTGMTPTYKENGLICFFTTMGTYLLFSYGLRLFSPTILYDHFGELICALCIMSFLCSVFLYYKKVNLSWSTEQTVSKGSIFNFFWGKELYPRVYGYDIKQFITCRFAMTFWSLVLISFTAKQSFLFGLTNSLIISVLLQLLYITKFFYYESDYLKSFDIISKKVGFYLCWSFLVGVPVIYTSTANYLVNHPIELSISVTIALFALGALTIYLSYLAQYQKQKKYLLASGFWKLSRQFDYFLEILIVLIWSLPALFNHFYPYFPLVCLTILLVSKAIRNEKRNLAKYGPAWQAHCKKVPYKIIPYIY